MPFVQRPTLADIPGHPNVHAMQQGGQMPPGMPPAAMEWRNALMDWHGARPQFSFDPSLGTTMQAQRGDWRNALMDWRQQRPAFDMTALRAAAPAHMQRHGLPPVA